MLISYPIILSRLSLTLAGRWRATGFRKHNDETRRRRDAEREAKRNQTIKPDSIKT